MGSVWNFSSAGSETAVLADCGMMSENLYSGCLMAYSSSPSPSHSPRISGIRSIGSTLFDQEKYLSTLLAERQKLSPFAPVLSNCCQLLNKEILRVTALLGNSSTLEPNGLEHGTPVIAGGSFPNGAADMNGWASGFQPEMSRLLKQPTSPHGSSSSLIVKKSIRVDVPVDKYHSTYNCMGRLLGPRGISLKRLEANTECRVLIRGKGSIKDAAMEEMMKGRPGYEHLNENLHLLVEAELPAEIIDGRLLYVCEILHGLLKPWEESLDFCKQHQLQERSILEGSNVAVSSVSPFLNHLGTKRANSPSHLFF